MMNVLLTGSTGYIGEKLVSAIHADGAAIRLISRTNNSTHATELCDFRNEFVSLDFMKGVDTVFHLAGIAHDSSKLDEDYFIVNVIATQKLAELAVKSGVKRFVFVSSVKSGGDGEKDQCLKEDDNRMPEGIYGKTKREAEIRLLKIGSDSGMHVSILRPALVYGPNVKGNLAKMIRGINQGWFPPLPQLNNKRSMVHVDDVIRAILFLARNEKANGEIFNLTDGRSHSSQELYETICKTLGKPIPKWRVPVLLFKFIALFSPRIKYKINKLIGDDNYSSKKLELLGFKTIKTLKDINETIF
jgi:UDP-glucose 4-epimerase